MDKISQVYTVSSFFRSTHYYINLSKIWHPDLTEITFFDQKIKLLSWRMACKTKNEEFLSSHEVSFGVLIDENKSTSHILKLYNYSRTNRWILEVLELFRMSHDPISTRRLIWPLSGLFILGFWSLLATKLQKYKNITHYLFTFCKARWAIGKKRKENHANKLTKIPKTKRRNYGMNETLIGKIVIKF